MSPKLLVITVNYCCPNAILEGMDAVVEQLRDLGNATFCIVDNKSPDDSLHILRSAITKRGYNDIVDVVASDTNGGFGAGNNVALQKALSESAPPDYFYFLNPDAIPRPGAIEAFLSFMENHPDAGIAGGLLCDEAGALEASLFRFPSFLSEVEHAISLGVIRRLLRNQIVTLDTPKTPTPVDWVAGTSFIARRAALETVGGFDETFFLYWEEIELCHRIRAARFEIYGVPDAIVQHSGGVSTGMHKPDKRIPPYWFASRNHFFKSTGQVRSLTLLNLSVAGGLAVRRLHQALRKRSMSAPHFLRDFVKYSFRAPQAARPNPLTAKKGVK